MAWDAREYDAHYRRYAPMVQRRARALLGNDAEALDVMQDLFASLFERPEQFTGKSQISTFLYAATTHACWSRLRQGRTRSRLLEQHGPAGVEPTQEARGHNLTVLQDVLSQLDEELAQVAVYYYLDEMTHAEIAEILGCSRRQVGYLLDRLTTKTQRLKEAAP
jgi:RNA polymerase sigma factor (sigma-70 family)